MKTRVVVVVVGVRWLGKSGWIWHIILSNKWINSKSNFKKAKKKKKVINIVFCVYDVCHMARLEIPGSISAAKFEGMHACEYGFKSQELQIEDQWSHLYTWVFSIISYRQHGQVNYSRFGNLSRNWNIKYTYRQHHEFKSTVLCHAVELFPSLLWLLFWSFSNRRKVILLYSRVCLYLWSGEITSTVLSCSSRFDFCPI